MTKRRFCEREAPFFAVEGNNGGSYINIHKLTEGMIRLEVGETCITTVNQDISVGALACILTWVKDRGFQKTLEEYLQNPGGTPETICIEHDIAVAARTRRAKP